MNFIRITTKYNKGIKLNRFWAVQRMGAFLQKSKFKN